MSHQCKTTLLLLSFLPLFGGCANKGMITVKTPNSIGYIDITCERAIDYQGKKILVEGVDIPLEFLGADQAIKVAKIDVKEESIRQASDLIAALDLLQFSSCQNKILFYNDIELQGKAMMKEQDAMNALTNLLRGLNNSQTEAQYQKAIEQGSDELSKVSSKPDTTSPKTVSAP